MKVHLKHGKVTKIMHRVGINYRYGWDVSEAYERAKMFKEKVKKWHDKRISKHEFNVGDKVLFYRSHLRFSPCKLLSKWERPYHVEEFYRSGALKIVDLDYAGAVDILNEVWAFPLGK